MSISLATTSRTDVALDNIRLFPSDPNDQYYFSDISGHFAQHCLYVYVCIHVWCVAEQLQKVGRGLSEGNGRDAKRPCCTWGLPAQLTFPGTQELGPNS